MCDLLVANLQETLSSQVKVRLRLSHFHGPVYSLLYIYGIEH